MYQYTSWKDLNSSRVDIKFASMDIKFYVWFNTFVCLRLSATTFPIILYIRILLGWKEYLLIMFLGIQRVIWVMLLKALIFFTFHYLTI